ncbi:hypothetical protein ACFYPC_04675 [Streptomyces sp. NPDC005808]|uniref:hypothetical protein n=1 Tax=Streptomyces sp. NPDC005808 TaxID=3364734 RepID=UPI0036AE0BD0
MDIFLGLIGFFACTVLPIAGLWWAIKHFRRDSARRMARRNAANQRYVDERRLWWPHRGPWTPF